MQMILQRRWDEVQRCLASKSNLAASVMMGACLNRCFSRELLAVPTKVRFSKLNPPCERRDVWRAPVTRGSFCPI
jgi:hypothetical protein